MYPPCVEVNKKIIPEIRRCVVKELKEHGFKEVEIAKILRISQGMVSKYFNEKCTDEINLRNLSKRISNMIIEGYDEIKINEALCSYCINLRSSLKFCNFHYIDNCTMCSYIYRSNFFLRENEMKEGLINALKKLSSINCESLIPEVRSNLVYAKENPSSYMDVMAFPGRISCFKGKFIYYMEPEFGASKFLSKIIMNFKNSNIRSVMNIKFDEKILENIAKKFSFVTIKDMDKDLKNIDKTYDFIINKGGLWIEPEIYVLGKDPDDVVKKILEVFK